MRLHAQCAIRVGAPPFHFMWSWCLHKGLNPTVTMPPGDARPPTTRDPVRGVREKPRFQAAQQP